MKFIFLIFLLFLLHNCSKPKTVLICGDHVCINKSEAEQYFEENLSLEVKVVNKKSKDNINLVELNLKKNKDGKKITLLNKKNTNEQLKKLTKEEKNKIKKSISKKREEKKVAKKNTTQVKDDIDLKVTTNDKKAKPFNKKNLEIKSVTKMLIKM